MKEKNKFLIGILLFLLFASVICSSIPNTKAELTQQKGINIMQNVVGLDVKGYSISAKEILPSEQSLYSDIIPQDIIAYNLTSTHSKVDALCTFINGSLHSLYVTQNQGSPLLTTTENKTAVDLAKDFLASYQTYTGQPLFGQLKGTLDKLGANANSTQVIGDKVLQVNSSNGFTNFKWYYSVNDIVAPYAKFVSLSVSNGSLNSFMDNWNLYTVDSTSVAVSKEQAVQIALIAARNHNWTIPIDAITLNNLNVVNSLSWSLLTFDSSLNASLPRSPDPLQLYPSWHFGLTLNKWYGPLYGIEVDVWADTGQVRSVSEEYSTLPEPQNRSTTALIFPSPATQAIPNLALLIIVPIVGTTTVATAYLLIAKRNQLHSFSILKKRGAKITVMICCFLMCSTIVFEAISPVAATTRGASIFGSRSSGAINSPQSQSWRKTDSEIFYQWSISVNAHDFFQNNGYYTSNRQGSASTHYQILNDLNGNYGIAAGVDYYAVVDFDHGVGNTIGNEMHYMFEDDVGTEWGNYSQYYNNKPLYTHINEGVYDYEIFNTVNPNKMVFALINTCMSADYSNANGMIQNTDNNYYLYTQGMLPSGNARSMPFAFTHRWVESTSTPGFNTQHDQNPDWRNFNDYGDISNDGYANPDTGSNAYLGFPWGSAAISQHIPFETNGPLYWTFLMNFFYLALNYDYSVNQALDIASDWTWGCGNFAGSPLHTGFRACWPEIGDDGQWHDKYGYGSTLAVYGNGDIHLKQYEPSQQSFVSVSATADVAATASHGYADGTSPTISWQCADDYGAYYCYITEVIVDGVSHSPYDYGNSNIGSITFNSIGTDHSVVVHSAPYYYPVTFNQYAHNDNFGDTLVNSWTEYHVAWEERDGPNYCTGSDLHGGGGVDYYVDSAINDPWGWGTDYFSYAMAHNWGGGSESYYYGIPMNVWTFTWGNTVDIWYNWQGYGMNGRSSNTSNTDAAAQPTVPTFPANFTSPASTPYIYNSTTNTYTPVR